MSFCLGRGKGVSGSGTVLTVNLIRSCSDIRFMMSLLLRPKFQADLAVAYRIRAEILLYIVIRILILVNFP